MLAKQSQKNGRGERVGSVSGAGRSFASTARKSKSAAPFHERVEISGKILILEHGPEGILVCTESGVFINPWTSKPFQLRKDAIKAVKFRLQHGFWPKRVKQEPSRPKKTDGIIFNPAT